MALPPIFTTQNLTSIPFSKADGVNRPDVNIPEPGAFFDDCRNDVLTAHFPQVTQITDLEPTGTFDSTATWTLTVTPLTTQSGSAAAAHGMAAESVSYTADTEDASEIVTGLIAAVATASASLTPASLATWNRIGSYVTAEVDPDDADQIRLTARTPGATFSATLSSTLAGDSYTSATIASPQTDTVKPGLYYALDTSKGTDGYDAQGKPYLKTYTTSVPEAETFGPVYLGAGTKPVERGFAYREYEAGNDIPVARYGHITAYGDSVIALAGGPEPVWIRHTTVGDYLAGMVTDAAGAAVGATANLWTGTPTAADDTLYTAVITYGSAQVQLQFTSGTSATATTITTGLKADLAKYTGTGGLLYGLTGSGTATFIITGPADGRGFTPVSTSGGGVLAWVETTAEVNTHTLFPRDKFLAPSTRIGSVRVGVPQS